MQEGLRMDDTRNEICRKVLETSLEEIQEDVFFRADNFQNEPWYDEFMIYRNLGVCQPRPEHVLEVQKALKVMGYPTHTAERNGKTYLLPGEERADGTKTLREERKMARLEERQEAASQPFQKFSRQKGRER